MGATDLSKSIKEPTKSPNKKGIRHVQAFLMFVGMVFGYFQRVNISAAIVPMTNPTAGAPFYNWNHQKKSFILSSFFWGYVVSQVPLGLLAKRYGAKYVLAICVGVGSIVSFFHPLAAEKGDWICVVVLRVITGLLQGSVYPCMHTMLVKWVPAPERSTLSVTIYSGAQLGTAVTLATSGFVFESAWGWPGIFYITGALGLIWSVVFVIFGAEDPAQSKCISKTEREYIESYTRQGITEESLAVPWKSIFTSLPFYALLAAHCGFTWGFYLLLSEIPTYMNDILTLNVKSSALLSALPYIAMLIMCLVISPISDALINRGILQTTTARKLFNSIGEWIPMVCLIALGYVTAEQKILAITLLAIAVGINAGCTCGYLVNHMDLSPNFAGTMMAVTNGIAGIFSILAPLLVGQIVTKPDPNQWRLVFYITAVVYFVSNLLFVIFGKATIQKWNNPPNTRNITILQNYNQQSQISQTDIEKNHFKINN